LLATLAPGFAIGMINGAGISYVGIPPHHDPCHGKRG
jgi:ribose/xylose/arabinose/galactoside ABC-type transport system permease subunit